MSDSMVGACEMARVSVHFVCISARQIVNGWSHRSSICLNVQEHVPCAFPCVHAVPRVSIMYAARVHVLSDTPACFMCRLCPRESIDQDPCEWEV